MSENNEPHCCCAVEVFNNFEPLITRFGSKVESAIKSFYLANVDEELIDMQEGLLTTESSQQSSDDASPACPKEDTAVSQQPANSQPQEKPKSDKSAKPLFANEADKLMANVLLIKECVADQSWELIASLTKEWTQEFKSAVWKQLTAEERKAVWQLKPQE